MTSNGIVSEVIHTIYGGAYSDKNSHHDRGLYTWITTLDKLSKPYSKLCFTSCPEFERKGSLNEALHYNLAKPTKNPEMLSLLIIEFRSWLPSGQPSSEVIILGLRLSSEERSFYGA